MFRGEMDWTASNLSAGNCNKGQVIMSKFTLLAAALTALLATAACSAPAQNASTQNVSVPVPAECFRMDLSPYSPPEPLSVITAQGARPFQVEIAADYATREQGLMCRPELTDTQGMLFEFQDSGERTFWMKDTLIALDIIYIAPDCRIVSNQGNARPLDRTPLRSFGAANGVLADEGALGPAQYLHPVEVV